jgi:hypothetical protein
LADWAKDRGGEFFLRPIAEIVPAFGKVSAWVTSQGYDAAAVSTFSQIADYYLVAHALAGGYTIVTHEVPAATVKKVKIPNACIGLGIKHMTPFEMLRREKVRFVLGG